MQIDAFTILLFGVFIKTLLGVLFVIFWFSERRAIWFVWWAPWPRPRRSSRSV